jgi:hypothetical protein
MNDPRKIKSNPARRFIVGLAPRLIGLAVLIALVTGALVGVTLIQTSRGRNEPPPVCRAQIAYSRRA